MSVSNTASSPDPSVLTIRQTLALAALFALVAALSVFDSSYLHPGFSDWDDAGNLGLLQLHREGAPLVWSFARGCWHRLAAVMSVDAFGPGLGAVRLPALLGLGLQAFATAVLAARLIGPRAAFWAGAAVLASANALLRGRSVLAFSLWPAELALMLSLVPALSSRPRQALWGLAVGALALDYEGWSVSLPALAFAWVALSPGRQWKWALAGFGVAAAGVAALSAPNLEAWWSTRTTMTVPPANTAFLHSQLGHSLRTVFLGGPAPLFLGAPFHPLLPAWSLPLALAGLLAWPGRRAWLLAGLAVALLPAFLNNSHAEPQRFLGFCALAALPVGAGAAWAQKRWPWRGGQILGLILGLGLLWEVHPLQRGMALEYARDLAFGANQVEAARAVARRFAGRPVALITELGPDGGAPLRFIAAGAGVALAKEAPLAVAAIPKELEFAARRDPGLRRLEWLEAGERSDVSKAVFVVCDSAARARFEAIEAVLRPLRPELRNLEPRAAAKGYRAALESAKGGDPWLLSSLTEAWLDMSIYVGDLTPAMAQDGLTRPLLSGAIAYRMAQYFLSRDQDLALRAALRSVEVDPTPRRAWILAARLLARPGQGRRLQRLRQDLERWHPGLQLELGGPR